MKRKTVYIIILSLAYFSCSKSHEEKETEIVNDKKLVETKEIESFLKERNLTICEWKRKYDSVKQQAIIKADKKFPTEVAKHDKYIELLRERGNQTLLSKYKLSSNISSKIYKLSINQCK